MLAHGSNRYKHYRMVFTRVSGSDSLPMTIGKVDKRQQKARAEEYQYARYSEQVTERGLRGQHHMCTKYQGRFPKALSNAMRQYEQRWIQEVS